MRDGHIDSPTGHYTAGKDIEEDSQQDRKMSSNMFLVLTGQEMLKTK